MGIKMEEEKIRHLFVSVIALRLP